MIEITKFDQFADLLPRFRDGRLPWVVGSRGFSYRHLHRKLALRLAHARMLGADPEFHMVRHDGVALRNAAASRRIPGRYAVGLAVDRGDPMREDRKIRDGLALHAEEVEPDARR